MVAGTHADLVQGKLVYEMDDVEQGNKQQAEVDKEYLRELSSRLRQELKNTFGKRLVYFGMLNLPNEFRSMYKSLPLSQELQELREKLYLQIADEQVQSMRRLVAIAARLIDEEMNEFISVNPDDDPKDDDMTLFSKFWPDFSAKVLSPSMTISSVKEDGHLSRTCWLNEFSCS